MDFSRAYLGLHYHKSSFDKCSGHTILSGPLLNTFLKIYFFRAPKPQGHPIGNILERDLDAVLWVGLVFVNTLLDSTVTFVASTSQAL